MKTKNEAAKLFFAKMLAFFAPKYCIKHKTLKSNPNGQMFLPSLKVQYEMIQSLSETELAQRYWSATVIEAIYAKGIIWAPNAFEFLQLASDIKYVRLAYAKGLEFTDDQLEKLMKRYGIHNIVKMGGKAVTQVNNYLMRNIEYDKDYTSIVTVYTIPELNTFYQMIKNKAINDQVSSCAIASMIGHLFAHVPQNAANEYGRGILTGYYKRLNSQADDYALWLSLAMGYMAEEEVLKVVLNRYDHILAYLKNATGWKSEFIQAMMKVVEPNCNNSLVYFALYEACPECKTKDELADSLIQCSTNISSLSTVYNMLGSKLQTKIGAFVGRLLQALPKTFDQKYVGYDEMFLVEKVIKESFCTEELKKQLIHALVVGKKLSEETFAGLSEEMQKFVMSAMEEQSQRDLVLEGHETLESGKIKLLPSVEAFMFSRKDFQKYWKPYIDNQELSLEGFQALLSAKNWCELGSKIEPLLESYLSKASMDETMYRLLMSSKYSHLAPRYKEQVAG